MKILVTGGLGFIGSHLCPRLLEDGHEVYIYDNRSNNKVERILGTKEVIDFKSQSWDLVYHLAAKATINPGYDFDTITSNIILAREVLSLPTRVVYCSSAAVKHPKTLYALSKMDNDEYAKRNQRAEGVRFENVYGERDNGVIGKILRCCLSGELFTINGGTQQRDFVYVSDVIEQLVSYTQWVLLGEVTPIGTGVVHTIEEAIQICERVTGKLLNCEYGPLADHEAKYSICEKPLKTFVGLESGIHQYYLSLTL